MFSVVNAVVVKPLRIGEPDRVVRLLPDHEQYGESDGTFALADLDDLRSGAPALGAIAAFDGWSATLESSDQAIRVPGAIVSSEYFEVLGVEPLVGRFFLPEDGGAGADPVVVLSHDFWRTRMGGDPSIVGGPVRLNGLAFTVIGVAPGGIEDPRLGRGGQDGPRLWRAPPPTWFEGQRAQRGVRSVTVIARVAPSATIELAQSQASRVFRGLAERFPETNRGWGVRLVSLKEAIVAPVRRPLQLLGAMVVLLLVIACVNVANLFLIRASTRERELALRVSLGASRGHILRQLLLESAILAFSAGILGVLIAALVVQLLPALADGELPRLGFLELDATVLMFGLGLTGATGVIFGLVPLLRVPSDPSSSLSGEGRGLTTGNESRRFHAALLGVEAGLTLVLLVSSGLLVRSYASLTAVDPGFAAEDVLTLRFQIPARSYDTDVGVRDAFDLISRQVGSIPGVSAVGFTNILPFSGGYWSAPFTETDLAIPLQEAEDRSAEIRTASPEFFDAIKVDLLEGRVFSVNDDYGETPVAIVNRRMVEEYWPGQPVVGRQIELFDTPYQIVGVVESVRGEGLDLPPEETIYLAQSQAPTWLTRYSFLTIAVDENPTAFVPAVREAFLRVDRNIPIYEIRSMREVIARTTGSSRFRTVLLGAFALLAFVLAGVGVYGVSAYTLATRRREFGIRIALGATRGNLMRTIADEEFRPLVYGLAAGLGVTLLLVPNMAGLLFGVTPYDVPTIMGALIALLGVACLAAYGPFRQAVRTDPNEILRDT